MDKFCQISTELLLLIHVQNWFQCSSAFFGQLPLNFVYELMIKWIGLGLDKFGIVDG